jgi:hypothetical protein
MQEHQNLPDINRLSVLMGIILLAYALTAFVSIPTYDISFDVAGIVFEYALDFKFLVSILVAILAATGTDWLLRGHPEAKGQNFFPHLILPALTAWMIGVPLNQLQVGVQWWIILGSSSVLLILVFIAEYIIVDLNDMYHAPATVGVTAISFALYLYLAIAIRTANLRLYLMVPALVLPLALLCLRTFYIRLGGKIQIAWSLVIAFLIGQIALGLHYFPIQPLSFGLVILAPAYALTSLASALEENRPLKTSWIEPAIMLAILWGLLLLVR